MSLRTSVGFAHEPNHALGPLVGMFATLPSVPDYTLRDSLAEVFEGCQSGAIDIDAVELNNVLEFCENFATDVARSDEPTGLSEHLIGSVTLYTSQFPSGDHRSVYFVLNLLLRNEDRNRLQPFARFLWLLLHALKGCTCAEKLLGIRTVNRGLKGVLNSDQYALGREIVWYQISSCSTDLSVQTDFLGDVGARVLFIIELRCGRARDISRYSAHPEEKEVVLPPNSRFIVTGVLPQGELSIVNMREVAPLDPILEFGATANHQVRLLRRIIFIASTRREGKNHAYNTVDVALCL